MTSVNAFLADLRVLARCVMVWSQWKEVDKTWVSEADQAPGSG